MLPTGLGSLARWSIATPRVCRWPPLAFATRSCGDSRSPASVCVLRLWLHLCFLNRALFVLSGTQRRRRPRAVLIARTRCEPLGLCGPPVLIDLLLREAHLLVIAVTQLPALDQCFRLRCIVDPLWRSVLAIYFCDLFMKVTQATLSESSALCLSHTSPIIVHGHPGEEKHLPELWPNCGQWDTTTCAKCR